MAIYQSGEDYLEKILMLHERLGYAKSIDIDAELKVSKPSVSIALKKLREDHYVEMDDSGCITLTPEGRKIAERSYDRHKVLSALLRKLGVSDVTAASDACKMEHVVSDETFSAICRFVHKTL